MWSSLGTPPAADEIEVTVIGPGFGEAILVHLSNGQWLIVDSCVDTTDGAGKSAPVKYLESLGVDLAQSVKLITVSHWDDDHVRGIAQVVEQCPSAIFCCSTELTKREFVKYVEYLSEGISTTDGANIGNFKKILELLQQRGQLIYRATPGRQLFQSPLIRSWSPSDYEGQCFLDFVAEQTPKARQTMRRGVQGSPNLTSVVLSIDWDHASVLLGADMEYHSDDRRGWGAIVSEATRIGFPKCELLKVPHHGSANAHDDRMWSQLMKQNPISVIAPYGRGKLESRPPKSTDIRRINSHSSRTFLTARHQSKSLSKQMDSAVKRSLREGGIKLISQRSGLGIVRFRKKPSEAWRNELFGVAIQVK